MPIWPFRKRRSNLERDASSPTQQQPLTEKSSNALAGAPASTPARTGSQRKRRVPEDEDEKAMEAQAGASVERLGGAYRNKENTSPRRDSIEDITALPFARKLDSSPHLRPVASERPHIPYNFRNRAASQDSLDDIPPFDVAHHASKPSSHSVDNLARRQSSKKRKKDPLREEEIRAMSASATLPKRAGHGPGRRESKKQRGVYMKDSTASLPPQGSMTSFMAALFDSRGWEVGTFEILKPRPSVRPYVMNHYGSPISEHIATPPELATPVNREDVRDKRPASKREPRKRQLVGDQADDFDASDLRTLLERDAKRRERRKKQEYEKLDRKLRAKASRDRGDSDKSGRKRRQQSEERAKQNLEEKLLPPPPPMPQDLRSRPLPPTPLPTAIHPALRDEPAIGDSSGVVGLVRTANSKELLQRDAERSLPTPEPEGRRSPGTPLKYSVPQNPFEDPEPALTPASERATHVFPPTETPMENPVLETARQIRMSYTATPPLSPVTGRGSSSVATSDLRASRTGSLPEPPPFGADRRRSSEPRAAGRLGSWATFFRRGGSRMRSVDDVPSEASGFSNISRESLRNKPLPSHLVDITPPIVLKTQRSISGTPQRTLSKFREDLPEFALAQPEARVSSPDITAMAGAVAAARRGKLSPQPVEIPENRASTFEQDADRGPGARTDTPMTPTTRPAGYLSGSLASIDSEGSWLAGGPGKRASNQSGAASLRKRNPEWTASYEELGGDKDAEYFQKSPGRVDRKPSTPTVAGAAQNGDDASVPSFPATPNEPMVHEGVQRQPTLVKRDNRVRSTEALLGQFETDVPASPAKSAHSETDSPVGEPHVERATSVSYKSHGRHISAGSAKLLDIQPSKRASMDQSSRSTSHPTLQSSRLDE